MEGDKKTSYEYVDEYRIVKVLGAGYSAEVKLGVDLDNKFVAIKQYKHETSTLETLKEELAVMKELTHENLIKLIAVKESALNKKPNQPALCCFAIVLEYAGGGELFDFVAESGKFSDRVARTYFHQMMNGIHYMHDRGYAHRDIKPENLLLTNTYILKIADFGFSTLIRGHDGTGVLHTKLGTEGYMAPQIASKHYDGRKTDIFAAGVILFIMFSGNPPFEKAVITDPYYKLLKEKRYDIFWNAHSRKRTAGFFTDSFKDLIQKMLAYVPNERPTILDISKHPWIKGSVCTHHEILEEFEERKKKMDANLEKKRAEKEAQRQRRTSNIHNQGYNNRDADETDDKEFMQIYNKEKLTMRKLPRLALHTQDDLLLDNEYAFVASTLKEFIANHRLPTTDDDSEDIASEDGDEYVCESITDTEEGFEARYVLREKVQSEVVESGLSVGVGFGEWGQGVQVQFRQLSGNGFYFRRLLLSIRNNCFP